MVQWSAGARADLADIFDYIAVDSFDAALRMDELLSAAAARLATFPKLGRMGSVPGTRELIPHASYRIVYDVADTTVTILSIVHTARQWPPVSDEEA